MTKALCCQVKNDDSEIMKDFNKTLQGRDMVPEIVAGAAGGFVRTTEVLLLLEKGSAGVIHNLDLNVRDKKNGKTEQEHAQVGVKGAKWTAKSLSGNTDSRDESLRSLSKLLLPNSRAYNLCPTYKIADDCEVECQKRHRLMI